MIPRSLTKLPLGLAIAAALAAAAGLNCANSKPVIAPSSNPENTRMAGVII